MVGVQFGSEPATEGIRAAEVLLRDAVIRLATCADTELQRMYAVQDGHVVLKLVTILRVERMAYGRATGVK